MPAATATAPRKTYALDWAEYVKEFTIATAQAKGIQAFSPSAVPATMDACAIGFLKACEIVERDPREYLASRGVTL